MEGEFDEYELDLGEENSICTLTPYARKLGLYALALFVPGSLFLSPR